MKHLGTKVVKTHMFEFTDDECTALAQLINDSGKTQVGFFKTMYDALGSRNVPKS